MASFTAAGQSSVPVLVRGGYSVTVSGTFVGKLVVQRSFDERVTGDTVWYAKTPAEVFEITSTCSFDDEEPKKAFYRLYASEWTSGTAEGRLG